MGRPKQLLPYRDTTVLGSVVETAAASKLTRTIVVLGAYADAIRAEVDLAAVEVAVNPEPDRGNLSSLLVAVAAAPGDPLLLMMGDAPGLEVATIDEHVDTWHTDPNWLRATRYRDGVVAHPLLLSPELIADLGKDAAEKPLWRFVKSEQATELAVEATAPIDIDTPEDYARALLEPDSDD